MRQSMSGTPFPEHSGRGVFLCREVKYHDILVRERSEYAQWKAAKAAARSRASTLMAYLNKRERQ